MNCYQFNLYFLLKPQRILIAPQNAMGILIEILAKVLPNTWQISQSTIYYHKIIRITLYPNVKNKV